MENGIAPFSKPDRGGEALLRQEPGKNEDSHDVTAAILVFQNSETAAMLMGQHFLTSVERPLDTL